MGPRQIFSNVKQMFPSILIAVAAVAGAGAALWFLPNRTAAVILGALAGLALTYSHATALAANGADRCVLAIGRCGR